MNILQKVYHIYANSDKNADYNGQGASDLIKAELLKDKPSMIARLGSTELQAIAYYINCQRPFRKPFERLTKNIIFKKMWSLSGFYPSTDATIGRFSEMMMEDAKEVDILGSWRKEEIYLKEELKNAKRVGLKDLEPYYHEFPYTEVLKDKKVLVIHPFEQSIKRQYFKRRLLFENPLILPDFELKTIKAVQSIANNKPEFDDWFQALEDMKNQIDRMDFDIAIIGSGAYGFPLAAHVKRIGKKAIHLGGAVQILFGIKGKRWEEHPVISQMINENWIKPDESEIPQNATQVDGGSYW
jgi:hypothetical protein